MVRQHMKDLQVQQPLQVNRSSMLQLLQRDKFDEKEPEETDFDGGNIGKVEAGLGSELDGTTSVERRIGDVVDDGLIDSHDPIEESVIDSHNPPIPNTINNASQVGPGQTTNAVDSGPKEKEEEHVPPLGPGEEMKMFRVANSKVGEMEERAKTMQGKLTDVDAAWGRVDGKLTSYGESIEDLKSQLSKLTESSHGLHGEVKEEFHGKEKFRMCSFVNAARVLKGQPEIDCNSIDDITD